MYKNIYESSKKNYERLARISINEYSKKQFGGAKVIGTVDYDTAIASVFASNFVHPIPSDLIALHGLVKDNINAGHVPDFTILKVRSRGDGSYKDQRYDSVKFEDKCQDDNAVFIKNADDAITYMEEIEKIYQNVELSSLETGIVLKPGEWVSFNWTITKPPGGGKFTFRAGNMNVVGSTEFGVKHTMLGGQDDLYFAGEGAIILDKARHERHVQFNLNSSSWDVNPLKPKFKQLENKEVPEVTIKNYISTLIKKIMSSVVAADSVYTADHVNKTDVQVSHIDVKFTGDGKIAGDNAFYEETIARTDLGIPFDPTQGILSYYKTPSCPDDDFVKGAQSYKNTNARTYELTQQMKKQDNMTVDVGNMRFTFQKGVGTNMANKPNDLINFDNLFINYLKGHEGGLPQTGMWETVMMTGSGPTFDKLNKLNTDDLGKAIAYYDSVGCKEVTVPDFKITTANTEYLDTKPFKVQGKGSGAFIINHGGIGVVKGNHFLPRVPQDVNDAEFKSKYSIIAEMWVNDYLKRKIIDTNISHNIAIPTDIFICDKKFKIVDDVSIKSPIKRDFKTKYTDIAPSNRFGYVAMELLSGTISEVPYLNFGSIFEYMYAKFVVCNETGIVFTDQANTGNCGYVIADYCRSYTLINAADNTSITLYVKDPVMIKMMDLESFEVLDPSKAKDNFFYAVNDVSTIDLTGRETSEIEDLLTKLNNLPNLIQLQGLIIKKLMHPRNTVVNKINADQMGTLTMMYLLILAFFNKTQCNNFMSIIKATVPAEYLTKPTVGIIKEFSYTIPAPLIRQVVKEVRADYNELGAVGPILKTLKGKSIKFFDDPKKPGINVILKDYTPNNDDAVDIDEIIITLTSGTDKTYHSTSFSHFTYIE